MNPDDELVARFGDRVLAARRPCRIGAMSTSDSRSYLGGLPRVDAGFTWPEFRGCPLELVASVHCADLGCAPGDGTLLFFRHELHIGFAADELGAARVIWQRGERELAPEDVPPLRLRGWLGTRPRFRVYPRRAIEFRDGWSYPDDLAFGPDDDRESYIELLGEVQHAIQHGGIASPANADDRDVRGATANACAKLVGETGPDDWELLLQLHDTKEIPIGDVGSVCWFVLRADLARGDYSRAWAVMTCS